MSDPVFLTVLRAGRPEHTPDVEGALLELRGDQAVVTLDDGETLSFDVVELRAALNGVRLHVERAA